MSQLAPSCPGSAGRANASGKKSRKPNIRSRKMKCEEVHRLLDIHLDGELDFARRLELEQHLAVCSSCPSLIEEHCEFRTFFAANVITYEAPPRLEARV